MARASIRTLLPLDRFAQIIGFHPLHFNQVTVPDLAPSSTCSVPVTQYSWNYADRMGREEIAQAIDDAERAIAKHAGFKLLPTWEVDERNFFRRPARPELIRVGSTVAYGTNPPISGQWGYIITGGIERRSVIEIDAPVVYTDVDGDGYSETATITVGTTVVDPDEVGIYYPGKSGANEWEIRPAIVTISGGFATIVCRREQLVIEDLMEVMQPKEVNGLTNANFLEEVDVYRHYNDPQQQVQFLWESLPNFCGCGGPDCPSCAYAAQMGCLMVRDYRVGIWTTHPGDWNGSFFVATNFAVNRWPDRARMWYYAGYRDMANGRPQTRMDDVMARAVTYYALSLLDRPMCSCANIERGLRHWREDLALSVSTQASSSRFQLSKRVLDNPLGTTRGAVYAWERINDLRIGKGVVVS